jgi:hypothetical protein
VPIEEKEEEEEEEEEEDEEFKWTNYIFHLYIYLIFYRKRSDRLWGPPTLPFKGYRDSLLGV